MKEKILILGSSSFAGYSFSQYLLKKKNFKVYGTYASNRNKKILSYKKKDKLKLFKIDLKKHPEKLIKLVNQIKPQYIIDFASVCMVNESWINPKYYFDTNFNSKIDLITKINSMNFLKKFIYIGTPEIFGSSEKQIDEYSKSFSPSTPYAISKLNTEFLLDNYNNNKNPKSIIVRFSNFYGRHQPLYRLIPKVIYSIKSNTKFPLHGSGLSRRDFIYDEDFNNGIYKVVKRGKVRKKYHFCTNKYYYIKDVIKLICKEFNYDFQKLVTKVADRKGKDLNYYLSCKKTSKELKWKPRYDLKSGLKKTIKFYVDNHLSFNKKNTEYENR